MNTRLALGARSSPGKAMSATTVEVAGHLPLKTDFLELGLMSSLVEGDGGRPANSLPDFLQRLRLTAGVDLGRWVWPAA